MTGSRYEVIAALTGIGSAFLSAINTVEFSSLSNSLSEMLTMGARRTMEEEGTLSLHAALSSSNQCVLFLTDQRNQLHVHVQRLRKIAARIDKFHKRSVITTFTGNCLSIAGAVATIVGLSLTPVTLGASLLASSVGLGVAAAGGAANVTSDLSLALSNYRELRKVREIDEACRKQLKEIWECLELAQQTPGTVGYDLCAAEEDPSDSIRCMILSGSHDFLVPKYSEEATKVSQAVLRAKVQRLAVHLESCIRILDSMCEQFQSGRTTLDTQPLLDGY
ncbi:apolipoprotein L domain-containing protein 1-like [Rhinatrema bivittatum]|uniref:apolipoprotein L domain-containing protein 1-like n=1 Tax=Rhinatrema bivittatum TaxID=194408 RepID=UPI00112A7DEB|nr:apolipoprotein L domain-containing protein 1-like [Rhinatrema bivittatum]